MLATATPRSSRANVPEALARQCRHQRELDGRRRTWWIPWLFLAGFGVSALGLVVGIARFEAEGSPIVRVVFLAASTVFFGWTAALWLAPPRLKPRIVPYFHRQIEQFGGSASVAFTRGYGLFRESVALERLAAEQGVTPLSAFGFADDYYDQTVEWHAASAGLRTVEALQRGLGPGIGTGEVARDLEALATVLRVAAERGVEFALLLRLQKDSIQAVSLWEPRQGGLW